MRTHVHCSGWLAPPMAFLLLFVCSVAAQAEENPALAETPTLTEREAVAAALSRPAWLEAESGRIAEAESVVTEAHALPNPQFAFNRDRVGMPGGDITERTVQISQTFDISGRRSLRQEAASQRLDAERLDSRARKLRTIAEVRRSFAEVQHRTQVQAVLGLWLTRIENAATVTAQLAQAGEVSGYDRRRIEREAQAAKARLSLAQADAARSREMLAALTGKSIAEAANLSGELLPDTTPALEPLRTRMRQRPDLSSMLTQAEAAEREQQAAGRGWIPDLTLGIGQRMLEEPTRSGSGAMVGVSFSIPLFDQGGAKQQRSRAQAQTIRAEHALAQARAEAELNAAWRQADELRKTVPAWHAQAPEGSLRLPEIAEAAYRAGEATLLELLDAYRSELDFSTTELDLALRARWAHIDLETLSGVSSYE